MLTKKLKFDDEVLDVIRAMDWKDNGKLGTLTSQLNRKLYAKVNEALDAMGGKWNRKAKGHIFPEDPRPLVEGLLENGHLEIERDGFFETPIPVIERMFELVTPYGLVCDPSAGMGAIAKQLEKHVLLEDIICVEKNPKRAEYLVERRYEVYCEDFMESPIRYEFDCIYMNPPFEESQDIRHIRQAYKHLAQGGDLVAVMSAGAFSNGTKVRREFLAWLDDVNAYVEDLPDGSFKESGTMVNTKLVWVEKQ